jgi:hypothetical protein
LHWKTKKKSTQEENATRDVRDVNERERERADRRDLSGHGGREGGKEVRDR